VFGIHVVSGDELDVLDIASGAEGEFIKAFADEEHFLGGGQAVDGGDEALGLAISDGEAGW
jgi:hypothetical protein